MHLTFLARDNQSPGGGSPTIYLTDRTDRRTIVGQGWKLAPDTATSLRMPDSEDAVELPLDLVVEAVRILGNAAR